MKNKFHFILLFLATTMIFSSCVKDEDPVNYGAETAVERLDPLLLVNTPIISFVAGEPSYELDLLAFIPAGNTTSKINVLSTYTDATSGETSNEVVLKTFDVSNGENPLNAVITYADLKNGITVNGAGLPDNEVDIPVGSKWDLTLQPVDGGGTSTFTAKSVTVGVLSPFAGIYTVIMSDYWRINVQSGGADWTGTQIFIGSIDATTFSHNDWVGPFGAVGFFDFTLNADNSITIEDRPDQLDHFTGSEMLTCQEDASSFVNVPCENELIPSADGKHIIKLTYGYYTASGDENEGAREFWEVLEKNL